MQPFSKCEYIVREFESSFLKLFNFWERNVTKIIRNYFMEFDTT